MLKMKKWSHSYIIMTSYFFLTHPKWVCKEWCQIEEHFHMYSYIMFHSSTLKNMIFNPSFRANCPSSGIFTVVSINTSLCVLALFTINQKPILIYVECNITYIIMKKKELCALWIHFMLVNLIYRVVSYLLFYSHM